MVGEQVKIVAARVVALMLARGYKLATAESCTGGSIAAAITSIAGCSAVFCGSVVSYSNDVKMNVLGVEPGTLETCGAVSRETVIEMVRGVQALVKADCAVATSGIAGPGGATPGKPVGTVWVAVAVGGNIYTRLLNLQDEGREANIENTVCAALSFLCNVVEAVKEE